MCAECGIKGGFFAKERWGKDPPHINLYGFDKSGKSVLMTQDHIKPRAKGGTNNLYNLQPMCVRCNSKKGSMWGLRDRMRYMGRKILHWTRRNY